jgi:hypothetical protein
MRSKRKTGKLISATLVAFIALLGVSFGSQSVASAAANCDASLFILPGGGFDLAAYQQCQNPESTTPEVTPGGTVVIRGGGYAPFSKVDVILCVNECDTPPAAEVLALESTSQSAIELADAPPYLVDDIFLGTVIADQFGNFTWEGTLPAGIEEGDYVVKADGFDSDGNARTLSYKISVVPPEISGGGQLPYTGSNTGRTVTIGAALVMLGIAATASAVRRRRSGSIAA